MSLIQFLLFFFRYLFDIFLSVCIVTVGDFFQVAARIECAAFISYYCTILYLDLFPSAQLRLTPIVEIIEYNAKLVKGRKISSII